MIDDAGFAFRFRLAYTLKITLAQALTLPLWEVEAWRAFFDVYGPLDFKRNDLLFARLNQFNCADKDARLRDFVLFPDPSVKIDPAAERNAREENLLRAFGYNPDTAEKANK